MKERLVFDPANADEGDKVGGYLYGAGGNLVTTTTVGGDEGLDVNVLNTLTVQATDFDIRDLDASQDNVAISDGTDTLAINTDGSINITDNGGSITVDGTVAATQSGTWTIDSITNPVTIQATNLDVRDLTHVSDSVKIGDGTDFLAVNADGSINVSITGGSDPALANTAVASGASSVTSTAANLIASALSGRKYMFVQNLGNRSIFVGPTGVTTATGFRLSPGAVLDARIGAAVSLFAITDAGTQDVRHMELS